jgi:geranylgeranyl diphosphate synthase type II
MSELDVVPKLLDRYGALVAEAMFHRLGEHDQRRVPYLHDLARDYPERGGRWLRASLCIAAARACGASERDAINSAVSIEMLHNAFLIHDDIEDLSEWRRGKPTMHLLHGIPIAINVGHALTVWSIRPLLENQRRLGLNTTLQIFEQLELMARHTVEGQALELAWRRDNVVDLSESDYLQMVLKKTCWYTIIFPLKVGTLIGASEGVDPSGLLRFGFFVGAAFQIADDLLNLVGDRNKYGKELEGDLWEGKRTLIMISLLHRANNAERRRIENILAIPREDKSEKQVRWLRAAIEHHDCLEYAARVAHGLAGAALHECDRAFDLPDTSDRTFLRGLAPWVIQRR